MSTTTRPAVAGLTMVTVDCADPRAEADFWSRVLGWNAAHVEDDYAMLTAPGTGTALGFGRVDGFTAPSGPDEGGAKQFHLDLSVDDLAEAEAAHRELGATVPDFQPGGDRWRVLLDPAGHPYCLTPADAWG